MSNCVTPLRTVSRKRRQCRCMLTISSYIYVGDKIGSVVLYGLLLYSRAAGGPGETPGVKSTEKVAASRQDIYAGE